MEDVTCPFCGVSTWNPRSRVKDLEFDLDCAIADRDGARANCLRAEKKIEKMKRAMLTVIENDGFEGREGSSYPDWACVVLQNGLSISRAEVMSKSVIKRLNSFHGRPLHAHLKCSWRDGEVYKHDSTCPDYE